MIHGRVAYGRMARDAGGMCGFVVAFAALLALVAGSARAADTLPGWSGTVTSEYTQHYTYGDPANPATVMRVQRGSLQTDGTSDQGDGVLTYSQSYEDSGPPSDSCPEGTDI